MSDHISGQQARELLDDTTPGPWTATKDHIMRVGWEQRERERSPWDDDDLIPWLADESEHVLMNPEPEWKPLTENRADMLLAAAAPELAATVGWLYSQTGHNYDGDWMLDKTDPFYQFATVEPDGEGHIYLGTGPYGQAILLDPDEAVEVARALLDAAEKSRHHTS